MDLLLKKLQQFFQTRSLQGYLVGGSLRDLLLGQQPQDLDLVVPGDPEQVARALADNLRGHFIALGLEKGVKRILLPKKPYGRLMIDIAPLHGKNIVEDLSQRDFTINALAIPIEEAAALATLPAQHEHQPASLIDPFNGWHDLRVRTLRVVQVEVFQQDPLRLLRAIRLSASRQLSIAPSTANLFHRNVPLLTQVAPERIRDELLQMACLPHVTAAVQMLDQYQLLPAIFPAFFAPGGLAAPPNAEQPDRRTWATLTCMATFLAASQGAAASLTPIEQQMLAPIIRLSQRPAFKKRWKKSPGRAYARSSLLLLAALLADLLQDQSAPDPRLNGNAPGLPPLERLQAITGALKRLTLGRQAAAFIVFLLQESAAPRNVGPRPPAGNRSLWIAARHYFERFGERGVDLAAFCLARQMAVLQNASPDDAWQQHTRICADLIEAFYYERNALMPPSLIDGQTLIARLGNIRGPMIGALLAKVRHAQLDGLIRTRAEALQLIIEQAADFEKEHGQPERLTIARQSHPL